MYTCVCATSMARERASECERQRPVLSDFANHSQVFLRVRTFTEAWMHHFYQVQTLNPCLLPMFTSSAKYSVQLPYHPMPLLHVDLFLYILFIFCMKVSHSVWLCNGKSVIGHIIPHELTKFLIKCLEACCFGQNTSMFQCQLQPLLGHIVLPVLCCTDPEVRIAFRCKVICINVHEQNI